MLFFVKTSNKLVLTTISYAFTTKIISFFV